MTSVSLEPAGIDELRPGDNMFQSPFWARFKEKWGWRPLAFTERHRGLTLLVLVRRFRGGFTLAYIPHGPDLRMCRAGEGDRPSNSVQDGLLLPDDRHAVTDAAAVGELLSGLTASLRQVLPREVGLLRFDPRIPVADRALVEEPVRATGLRPGAVEVQPPTTLLIGLDGGRDEVLSGMKSKWRYNVRLAEKRGVTVRASTKESFENDFGRWYALYEETAARDRIAIHSSAYYRDFLGQSRAADGSGGKAGRSGVAAERTGEEAGSSCAGAAGSDGGQTGSSGEAAGSSGQGAGNSVEEAGPSGGDPDVELLLAEHEGDLLAGIVTARIGGRATYVFGASSGHKRNLMPAYALQWHAMQRAVDLGCRYYDMFGLPPAEDSTHPMHGLYRFKTGFGGELVQYPGTVDSLFRPLSGHAFRQAERVRNYYYKHIRKR